MVSEHIPEEIYIPYIPFAHTDLIAWECLAKCLLERTSTRDINCHNLQQFAPHIQDAYCEVRAHARCNTIQWLHTMVAL